MKTQFRFFLVFASLFPIVPAHSQKPISPAPAAPAQLAKPTIDDLFLTQNLTATLLSPDGKSTLFMIQSDSGVNLWIADGSGATRPLTSGNQVDENPR